MTARARGACVECGRRWVDPAERWRAVLTMEDDGTDGVGLFCPDCAGDEFD